MKWWDWIPWSLFFECWVLRQLFKLSSFTFTKRLFSSSSFSGIKVVSSAYLRLLIFLPAILIPACESSNPAFHMMYSAYKLNKQGDSIQLWHTFFPALGIGDGLGTLACYSSWGWQRVRHNWETDLNFPSFEPIHCSMSGSNCSFLTCIQVSQETGEVVWYSHLFKNFPVCYDPHSQKL